MRHTLAGLATAIALAATTLPSAPGSATTGSVMTGHRLGVETLTDAGNPAWNDYVRTTNATTKEILRRTATQPRVRWYGAWTGTGETLQKRIRKYVANVQAGDRNTVVALAAFRIKAGGGNQRLLTAADKASYRAWYADLARAIGSARTVVVLEPDLPLTLPRHGAKDTAARLALVSGAVSRLEALPNTDVYLDTGSADWLTVGESVSLLRRAGVAKARGFALGATHYDSTASNIDYAKRLSLALAAAGIPGKSAVIDTADNGRPFTHAEYKALQRAGKRQQHFDNADPCFNPRQTKCDTLGIPPTTDVANPAWGLDETASEAARTYVDAYLWFGRPWLRMQASPYCHVRAMQTGRTTPWAPPVPQLTAVAINKAQSTCFAKP